MTNHKSEDYKSTAVHHLLVEDKTKISMFSTKFDAMG